MPCAFTYCVNQRKEGGLVLSSSVPYDPFQQVMLEG